MPFCNILSAVNLIHASYQVLMRLFCSLNVILIRYLIFRTLLFSYEYYLGIFLLVSYDREYVFQRFSLCLQRIERMIPVRISNGDSYN